MQKINEIGGLVLIGRTSYILSALDAIEGELNISPIISHTFIDFKNRIHLTFHEGHKCGKYKIFERKFGMTIASSERVAMGGKGAFLSVRLFKLSQDQEPAQIAQISYVTSEGVGTFRNITLSGTEHEVTFNSLEELDEAMSNIVTLARVVKAAIE
jgi:hypothetical protein